MLAVGVGLGVVVVTDQEVIHTLVRAEVIAVLLRMVGTRNATSYKLTRFILGAALERKSS
jgi:hypothetical protein